jgi:hypothetical protein
MESHILLNTGTYSENNLRKDDLFVDLNVVNSGMIEKVGIDLIKKINSNIQLDQVKAICKHQQRKS